MASQPDMQLADFLLSPQWAESTIDHKGGIIIVKIKLLINT